MHYSYDRKQIAKHGIELFQVEVVLTSSLSEWFELQTQSHRCNDRYVVVGFDDQANLLEIGIEEISNDKFHVFHAMKATTHKRRAFNRRKHKGSDND